MSVANANKFALLNEDGDDTPKAPLPVKTATPTVVVQPNPPRQNNRGRGDGQRRGGQRRGGAPNRDDGADGFGSSNPNQPGERFDRTENRRGRGGGARGQGGGGRGRGRPEGDRPPRGRYHDKASQTGRVDTEKSVNQGWGAETGTAELKDEVQGAVDASAEVADASGWGDKPANAADWEGGVPPPVEGAAIADAPEGEPRRRRRDEEEEEEDNTVTFEQYMKKRGEEDSALPKLENTREIERQEWKDAVQLLREDTEYFAGKSKTAPKTKEKKEKVIIPIDLPPPTREFRGGRGGRGGGRGGERGGERGGRGGERGSRGRGGPRGGDRGRGNSNGYNNRGPRNNVDVDDQSAFPSLS